MNGKHVKSSFKIHAILVPIEKLDKEKKKKNIINRTKKCTELSTTTENRKKHVRRKNIYLNFSPPSR